MTEQSGGVPRFVEPQRFPVKTWLIAFAGWAFDFYDLVLFSFLLIPIGRDLHLSATEEAWLLGVALGGSGLGGILFGYLSDIHGRKKVMMWTICLYSFGTALTAFSVGPLTLLAFRLVTGLGVGGEWAVGHALLAESSPSRMRGRASALLQAGEPVGVALAALMGLLGAPHVGWRGVFLISSASAAVAILVRRHLPESTLWTRQHELRLTPAAALVRLARARLLGVLSKGFLLGVFKLGTYWTCYTWLPKFLQNELGQPVGRSALWIVSAQAGQFLGMMAFGVIADRYGRRAAFTGYSLLTAAAIYGIAFHWQALLQQPVRFWGVLFAMGLGSGCTAGFGALLAELFPTDVRNFAMGTAYNSARGVQLFAPVVVGFFVARHGMTGGLGVPMTLAVLTAAWVWTLPETRSRDLATVGSAGQRSYDSRRADSESGTR
jgi:MFS family permease